MKRVLTAVLLAGLTGCGDSKVQTGQPQLDPNAKTPPGMAPTKPAAPGGTAPPAGKGANNAAPAGE